MKLFNIANVGIYSSSIVDKNYLFDKLFPPIFSIFNITDCVEPDICMELDVEYRPQVKNELHTKNLIFSTHTWDVYKDETSYFFALYLSEDKEVLNQALWVDTIKRKARFFYTDKKRKSIYHPLDRALLQVAFSLSNATMFHGSAFELDGQGFLAMGHSMSGKSTLVRTLKSSSSKVRVLNDEKNIIWKGIDEKYYLAPSPWYGDLAEISSKPAPLKSILFIERLGKNNLRKITLSEALAETVRNAFLPHWDHKLLNMALDRLESLLTTYKDNLYFWKP